MNYRLDGELVNDYFLESEASTSGKSKKIRILFHIFFHLFFKFIYSLLNFSYIIIHSAYFYLSEHLGQECVNQYLVFDV